MLALAGVLSLLGLAMVSTISLFELLRSPFTPPQPSPWQGEGVKAPLERGLGGVNPSRLNSSRLVHTWYPSIGLAHAPSPWQGEGWGGVKGLRDASTEMDYLCRSIISQTFTSRTYL